MKTKKTNDAGDGTYRCEACNFETKYSQNLQAHFKTLKHLGNARMSWEESVVCFAKLAYIPHIKQNHSTFLPNLTKNGLMKIFMHGLKSAILAIFQKG
jgi:hypothetical protein